MGFLNHVKVWSDVLDPKLDEKAAPSLGGVHLGREEAIYMNPVEFFKRTLITKHMLNVLENIVNVLLGRGGNKVVMLLSLFGGGKTHTLLTIYHSLRNPNALIEAKTESIEVRERLQRLVGELAKIGSVRIVVLDGYFSELAPTPVNPLIVPGGYKVQTLWGSLAHQLGRFGEVRNNDEKLLAPQADILAKLLGSEPVLILIDELADYIARLRSSGDPTLQNYAEQVISFIEHLVKAVDITNRSTLIISLPIEERGRGIEVEERYKSHSSMILSLHKSVSRVSSSRIVPVAPSDISSILKVRIFESIDSSTAKTVSSTLARIYSAEENREVFGENAVRITHRVEETYPFHPSYIDTLVSIVDKHEGLEKTRDAIRITRKIVRKLVETNSPAELIMPFHIDVEDREIRGMLLSHEFYRQYETVVEEDIVGKSINYEKPELVKAISKTIFVKTFVYAGSVKDRQLYPSKHEVLLGSFEPSMTRMLNLQPKDYLDALEWASNNLVYLLSEGERYWFTQFASPIRMVEVRAREVDSSDALKKIEEYAWKLLTKPYEQVITGSRKRGREELLESPFNAGSSLVLTEPKPLDHDSRDYILVACLTPLRGEEIEKIMYETSSGAQRRYANTVYLIYPRDSSYVTQMLNLAKLLIACEMVQDELASIYRDEEIREVMKRKLEKYCRGESGVEGNLVLNIIAGLNNVAYPRFDANTYRNTYGVADASIADTIIESATRALKNARPPKLYEELDFDTLEYLLSQNIGITLSEGDTSRSISDIIDYFYSNPRLPMVKERVIIDAIIHGVKQLRIGVKKSGRVFFKKIYECKSIQSCTPPRVEEGEAPVKLEAGDLVLPWRIALREQLEELKEVKEDRVAGGVKRTWYGIYIDGNVIPIAEAIKKFDLDILRDCPLVKITEFLEEGIDVKLDKYEVPVSPGEEVGITVLIERIGEFKGALSIEVASGELNTNTLEISDKQPTAKLEWRIKAPLKQGTYNYELRVLGTGKKVLKSVTVNVVVRPKGLGVVKGVPPEGTRLSLIEVAVSTSSLTLAPIGIIYSKLGQSCIAEEVKLEMKYMSPHGESKIDFSAVNTTLEDVKNTFSFFAQRYGMFLRHMQYYIRLRPRDGKYIVTPKFHENELREIENYITCYIYDEGA